MVDSLVDGVRLTKVLMDGGSGLKPTGVPFHGIIPGHDAKPLRKITLLVSFGTPDKYSSENLLFEVEDLLGFYHPILGRTCYTKFMAVPSYVYLKIKMSGPKGVITVHDSFQHAYKCEYRRASTLLQHWLHPPRVKLRPRKQSPRHHRTRRLRLHSCTSGPLNIMRFKSPLGHH